MDKHAIKHWERSGMGVAALVLCSILLFTGWPEREKSADNIEKINTLYNQSKTRFPDISDISADELKGRLAEEGIILVDSREKDEQSVSMIPGAISAQELTENIDEYANKIVIVYCTIGYLSGHYANVLRNRQKETHNLKGGVLAWAHEGGTFVDSQGNPTNRVHVYGPAWNLLPDSYEAVW